MNQVKKYFGIKGKIKSIQNVKFNEVESRKLKSFYIENFVDKTVEKKEWLLFETEENAGSYSIEVFYNNRKLPLLFQGSFLFEDEEVTIDNGSIEVPVTTPVTTPVTDLNTANALSYKKGVVAKTEIISPKQGYYRYKDANYNFIASLITVNPDGTLTHNNESVRWYIDGKEMKIPFKNYVIPSTLAGTIIQINVEYRQADNTVQNNYVYDIIVKGNSQYSQAFIDQTVKKKYLFDFSFLPNFAGFKNKKIGTGVKRFEDIVKNKDGKSYYENFGFTRFDSNYPNLKYSRSKLFHFSGEASKTELALWKWTGVEGNNAGEKYEIEARNGDFVYVNGELNMGYSEDNLSSTEKLALKNNIVDTLKNRNDLKDEEISIYSYPSQDNVQNNWQLKNYDVLKSLQLEQNISSDILDGGFNALLSDVYQTHDTSNTITDYNDWIAQNLFMSLNVKRKYGCKAYILGWKDIEAIGGYPLIYNSYINDAGIEIKNVYFKTGAAFEYLRNLTIWSCTVLDGLFIWDNDFSQYYTEDASIQTSNSESGGSQTLPDYSTDRGSARLLKVHPSYSIANMNIVADTLFMLSDHKDIIESAGSWKLETGDFIDSFKNKTPIAFSKTFKGSTIVVAQNFFSTIANTSVISILEKNIVLNGNQAVIIKI